MLFAHTVHEEFNSPAPRTGVDVETVACHKQLAKSPEDTPIRSFVEIFRSEVLEFLIAAQTGNRAGGSLRIHRRWQLILLLLTLERRIFYAVL